MGWLFEQHPPSGCSILLHEQLATVPSWKFKFKWISALASIPWFAVVCDCGFPWNPPPLNPCVRYFLCGTHVVTISDLENWQLSPFHSRGFLGRALGYQPHKRSSWKHACSTLHLYADNSIGKCWEMWKCAWNEMSNRKKARFPPCLLIPVSLGVLVFGSPNLAVYSD